MSISKKPLVSFHGPSRRARPGALFIGLLFIAGCLDIFSVTQPGQVDLGANFQVTVNFST